MDKKNLTIGILLLALALGAMVYQAKHAPAPVTAPTPTQTTPNGTAPTPVVDSSAASLTSSALAKENVSARTDLVLENDYVKVRFTDFGGAIKDIAFKKYPAELGQTAPFIFNELHVDPVLAIASDTLPALGRDAKYDVVSYDAATGEIVFRAVFENRVEVFRRYKLPIGEVKPSEGDPYRIRHETTFRNLTDQTLALPAFGLSLGTVAPVNAADVGQHLKTSYKTSDDSYDYISRSNLEGAGFLGFGGSGPKASIPYSEKTLLWGSVQNQFFVGVATPDEPARGITAHRVTDLPQIRGTSHPTVGVASTLQLDSPSLLPKGEKTVGINYYAGPKEYPRLSNGDVFKQDEDHVMDYGFFGLFSRILITIMNAIHGFIGHWGWSIVLTTLTLKILFVPLTLSAAKSAKRMQKLAPLLSAIKEKHKDSPQKQQMATMELFKEHKVNPLGGCLPILITIPFFMGFFQMLQSTAELRFQPFLWAADLSVADTVGHVFGFPINILPVLMGATMVIQMRMTPTSPTMDSAQAMMMKIMPYGFALLCYNFSCALAVYSTTNGLFTIGQQLLINRMKDDDPVPAKGPSGKPVKNVTPPKK